MARCNKSFFAILGLLNSKGPLSGYDINKIFDRTSNWYWSESNAQLYPMLKKLEEKGSVTSEMCQDCGARQRRVYTITDKGIDKLRQWLTEPIEPRPKREELLLKLRFGNVADDSVMLKHLQEFQRCIESKLHNLDHINEKVDTLHSDKPDKEYLKMTTDYATEILQAKKRWSDRVIKQLQAKIDKSSQTS